MRHRLTHQMIKQAKAGVLIDGGGLRLRISPSRNSNGVRKSWILRVTVRGGPIRELGLGSAYDVSLAEARELARAARKLAYEGVDPLAARNAERARRVAETARVMTFRQCAEAYIAAHSAGWKNAKHAAQWPSSLQTYAYPVIGDVPVQLVDVALVMKVLDTIWTTKTETATRVRQRIEAVLDWAKARGFRTGENPAQWRGHLDKLLPAPAKVSRVQHHAALPYQELPAFFAQLRNSDSVGAQAFAFAILTATRTSETLGARWAEIDLERAVWTIPAERMKAGRPHRVPLSAAALDVLQACDRAGHDRIGFVFPGAAAGRSLSSTVFLATLKRMNRTDITPHGFRSTFRDWAAEQTNFAREVAEGALAHVLADKVEAAYRRSDLFEKRRKLMEAWGRYCSELQRDRVSRGVESQQSR